MCFQFQCVLFYTSSGYYLLPVNRLASHHTSASILQFFHLETVTSLMWVEKNVLAVFFERKRDPSYVIYVPVPTVVGALCQGECLYCLNCTKFGQLILRKIIKIIATRCQILRLKCTKFDFGWGSAPDPNGGAYSAPTDP